MKCLLAVYFTLFSLIIFGRVYLRAGASIPLGTVAVYGELALYATGGLARGSHRDVVVDALREFIIENPASTAEYNRSRAAYAAALHNNAKLLAPKPGDVEDSTFHRGTDEQTEDVATMCGTILRDLLRPIEEGIEQMNISI